MQLHALTAYCILFVFFCSVFVTSKPDSFAASSELLYSVQGLIDLTKGWVSVITDCDDGG